MNKLISNKMGPSDRRGWLVGYMVLVLLMAGVVITIAVTAEASAGHTPLRSIDIGWTPPGWAICLWVFALLATGIVPFHPAAGAMIFVAVVYGFPRYEPEWEYLLTIRLPESIVFLTLAGWCTRKIVRGEPFRRMQSALAWVLIALVAWVAITTIASLMGGVGWPNYANRDPLRFVDALVLFLLAASTINEERDYCLLVGTLGITLAVRAALTGSWHGDHDLAGLIAIALPLLVSVARIVRSLALRLAFLAGSAFLSWVLLATQNRGAAVGVGFAIVLAWLYARRRWFWLAIGVPVLFVVAALFASTDYWQRFADIWEGGKGRSTAVSRLEIWEATLEMSMQHPVLGVGTGNFYDLVQEYSDTIARRVPHNNFLTILVETGTPGLVLYVIFFGGAFVVLARARDSGEAWQGRAAPFLAAAIGSYLAVGSFLTRQDMALAYLLVGVAVALQAAAKPRDDKAAT